MRTDQPGHSQPISVIAQNTAVIAVVNGQGGHALFAGKRYQLLETHVDG